MALATSTIAMITAASAAVSAIGSIQQGQAANNAAKFQAGIQEQQAERERQVGESNADDYVRKESRVMASRRALLSASGVESGEGSPLAVSEDIAGETELQALRIRNNATASATRLDEEAMLQRAAGQNAKSQSFQRAGSLLLSGLGDAYGGPGRYVKV